MELALFTYSEKKGWSVDEFPKLDSEKTLVIIFGASSFIGSKEKDLPASALLFPLAIRKNDLDSDPIVRTAL